MFLYKNIIILYMLKIIIILFIFILLILTKTNNKIEPFNKNVLRKNNNYTINKLKSININNFKQKKNCNRNVFIYWVGKDYKLINILRKLIYLHSDNGKGYNIHFITDKNINKYIKNKPKYFNNLQPAHQADFVRVNVICDYGGIWLDSDILVLDSLDTLFDIIEKKNGFFIKENSQHLSNGIFGSKKNTKLMNTWKTNTLCILNNKEEKIDWMEIGSSELEKIKKTNPEFYINYTIFDGLNDMYPVNWNNCVDEYINKPYSNYKHIIRSYQPLIVLVNSVYKKLEDKTYSEILNGNMPINYFINTSVQNINK